ncbi:MAG: hypothetical protein AAGA21_17455 [Pseudomonadota bacterium]
MIRNQIVQMFDVQAPLSLLSIDRRLEQRKMIFVIRPHQDVSDVMKTLTHQRLTRSTSSGAGGD